MAEHRADKATLNELVDGIIRIGLCPSELCTNNYPSETFELHEEIYQEYQRMEAILLNNLYRKYEREQTKLFYRLILPSLSEGILDAVMDLNEEGY